MTSCREGAPWPVDGVRDAVVLQFDTCHLSFDPNRRGCHWSPALAPGDRLGTPPGIMVYSHPESAHRGTYVSVTAL